MELGFVIQFHFLVVKPVFLKTIIFNWETSPSKSKPAMNFTSRQPGCGLSTQFIEFMGSVFLFKLKLKACIQ